MATAKLRAIVARYGWLLVLAGCVTAYIWRPFWPHATKPLPLWPLLPIFVAVMVGVVFWVKKFPSVRRVSFGTGIIALYFYFEFFVSGLIFDAIQRGILTLSDFGGYLIISILNLLLNLPVLVIFFVLEMIVPLVAPSRTDL